MYKVYFLKRYSSLSLLVVILIASFLIAASCAGDDPAQDGWGQRYTSNMYEFSFVYPQEMQIKTEKVRDGAVTIHLKQASGKDLQLVFYMFPEVLNQEELASEAHMILNSSLYQIQSITEKRLEDVAGKKVMMLEALAGAKEVIKAGVAAFSVGERSFFIIIITPEENYTLAENDLYRVIESVD